MSNETESPHASSLLSYVATNLLVYVHWDLTTKGRSQLWLSHCYLPTVKCYSSIYACFLSFTFQKLFGKYAAASVDPYRSIQEKTFLNSIHDLHFLEWCGMLSLSFRTFLNKCSKIFSDFNDDMGAILDNTCHLEGVSQLSVPILCVWKLKIFLLVFCVLIGNDHKALKSTLCKTSIHSHQ